MKRAPAIARPRYCVISPCRDEAAFMEQTLDSVASQTVPPDLWVIVDDGSTDRTPDILADYARRFPFIRVVQRANRGRRSMGCGVIEAFDAGLATIDLSEFDYVCKLDLDLVMPPSYFENILGRMQANPRLGTCSGKPYYVDKKSGQLVSEGCGDETSIGAAKFYRRDCFREIGGFVREVMWDGIDCHRCRKLGWIACSWDEPDLRFIHLRPMGSSDHGIIRGRMRHGAGQYFMGTGPLYLAASAIFRMTKRPWILGGLAMLWGYFGSALERRRRLPDPDFRHFLRRFQSWCLLVGKRRATAMFDNTGEATWRARRDPLGS
jgi:poly-beta-1,6-N-acetyl-D-glucosamine synthase